MKFWTVATCAVMLLGIAMGWPEVAIVNGVAFALCLTASAQ